ncbi:uncharacterized protein FOMMEDRAFT_159343 [Fomitiporia mediterranea MF3/22]|uniref:uncharacterized protein n=1 Tax=Fomitiporia mediterranea (strain MF3/22) TaxID=694068 RepID=UPI0004408DE9|nr:uncharacterized protein FOMMEDRAFT_159343 [Fomitiporia mediterranea MF3/22]EJD00595.1 hypothetical protein FOMMEDRAFT_159343 [Fomitiporia mediterranea MF3/22]
MRLAVAFICALFAWNSAATSNVTIDDAFGNPNTGGHILYFPSTSWQRGDGCTTCAAKPPAGTGAYRGTWHEALFEPANTSTPNSNNGKIISASATFTGTAVYVNCILTGSTANPNGNTDLTFFLDGNQAGTFRQNPNGDTTYRLQTVFAAAGLSDAQHTIRLETGNAGQEALVLLDSIIYTSQDDSVETTTISGWTRGVNIPPSISPPAETVTGSSNSGGSGSKTNVGVIVGPIFAVITIGVLVSIWICLRKRPRSRILVSEPPSSCRQSICTSNTQYPRSHNPSSYEQSSYTSYLQYPKSYTEGGTYSEVSGYGTYSAVSYITPNPNSSVAAEVRGPTRAPVPQPAPSWAHPHTMILQEPRRAVPARHIPRSCQSDIV